MKWKLSFSITGILLHIAAFTFAQSSNQNYVQTETMLTENGEHKITTIEYCDGLGRPYLTATTGLNTIGASAYSLKTLVYPNNAVEEWLPGLSDQNLEWKEASEIRQLSKETNVESNPFRSITYDVLGRELYSLGVGDKWHSANKYSSIQRFTNVKSGVAKLTVKQYRANKNNDIVENGVWETGSLSAEQTMDEDNKGMIVFTDLHGQKILERRFSGTDKYNDTYFVYNDYGLLSYVLTPMFQNEKSLGKYAYKYQYDTQNRLISKCLPGCEPIRYWYDDEDRLVFVQDNELQIKGKCRFMFYDVKGRVVLQGLCSNQPSNCLSGIAITQIKGLFDTGFSNPSTLQLVSPEFEAVYYYDNYDFFNVPAFSNYGYVNQMKKTANTNAMGLQTGSIVMASNGEKLYRVYYYTEKGLAYETRQSMLEGKLLLSRSNYSFTDNPLRTVYELRQGARIDSIVFENRYNQNNDALMSTTISYNGAPACSVSTLEYDKLGRLVKNTLPNKAGNIEYEYDIRNAVTKIQSNTYSEAIGYEGLYNGNIASTENFYGDYEEAGSYAYEYDVLNRMTKATFSNNNKYSEEADYDDNSNILHLKRWGKHNDGNYKKIDDLTYSYLGNQLSNIEDKAGQLVYDGSFDFKESGTSENYAYNTNGSMTFDPNKGLTIDYSDMGHPKKMTFNNGNTTEYTYSIEGEKLKVEWNTANTTTNKVEYVGPFILKDGKLDAFLFSGGIATIANNQATFHFYIKDHLGSNRIVVSEDGTIKQKLYYYPFGGLYGDICVNPEFQRYKYNGKEYDHQHGLDLSDYGARMYNPVIGSWLSMDSKAEKYYHISPYTYCYGNPIKFIDPDGERPKASEAALMAVYVYGDKDNSKFYKDQLSKVGWELSKFPTSIQMNYKKIYQHGLQSTLFERTTNGVTEYAYVYAGTNSVTDAVEDIVQLAGASSQYYTAINNAKTLSRELGGSELTFVGHSLGGGEAIAASMATGRAAITFNSAAVSWLTKQFGGLNKNPNVVNYRAIGAKVGLGKLRFGGDILNNLQEKVGLALPGMTIGIPMGLTPTHTIYDFLKFKLPEPWESY